MTPSRCVLAALALVLIAGAACTRDGNTEGLVPEPLDDVTVQLGEVVSFDDVDVAVRGVSAFESNRSGFPRVAAVLRSENFSDSARLNPDIRLLCDENPLGGTFNAGSTWEAGVVLQANTVQQGEAILEFPPKPGADRYSVATCTNPRVQLRLSANLGGSLTAFVPIPDEVIERAIVAPRGPKLPLDPAIG